MDRLERLRRLPLLRRVRRLPQTYAPGALPGCEKGVGYNYTFRNFRPGGQFDLAEQGILDPVELDPYYKDEIIAGFEWQVSNNWAFDGKAIYWELGDIIMNTTQRYNSNPGAVYNLQNTFQLSVNDKNFQHALRQLGVIPEDVIDDFEEPFKEYQALQLQINRRFSNGWAVYNNLTLSKLETTGSGAWWNNTSSSYGEDFGIVLTQAMIDSCNLQQAADRRRHRGTAFHPDGLHAELTGSLGIPVSAINRAGRDGLGGGTGAGDGFYGSGVDRPYIWKTFGFKQWNFGARPQPLNVGGLFTYQDGAAWGRGEQVAATSAQQPDRHRVHPAREERRAASGSLLRPQPDAGVGLPDRRGPGQGQPAHRRDQRHQRAGPDQHQPVRRAAAGAARVPAPVDVPGDVRRQLLIVG